jgi:hypothetical protein
MGRVAYNHSLYRTGYRPYGKTNTFQAAQGLSGTSMPQGPFGPWRLSGDLGQNPPFTRSGGFKLHGLGQAGIPDGSLITYHGTWTSVFNTGQGYSQPGYAQAIVDGVVAALNADGQLAVLSYPRDLSSSVSGTVSAIFGSNAPFDVSLQLQVTNGMGFGSVNDIISIIRHYVYTISGQFPVHDQIVAVNSPGSGAPNWQATGTPPPPGPPPNLTAWLEKNIGWIALGIGAALVLPRILP